MTGPFAMFGGFATWLMALTGLLYLAALVLQWRASGTRNLLPLLWSLFAAILIFGLFGDVMGDIQYAEALAFATEEMRDTLATAGSQASLYSMGFALWLAVPIAIANGVTALRIKHSATGAQQPSGGS